jgi:hypothetical protein
MPWLEEPDTFFGAVRGGSSEPEVFVRHRQRLVRRLPHFAHSASFNAVGSMVFLTVMGLVTSYLPQD